MDELTKKREGIAALRGVVARAAAALPRETGTVDAAVREAERVRTRMRGAGDATVLLLDVSSSMAERAGARARIEILREALAGLVPDLRRQGPLRLVAFSSVAREIGGPDELPAPYGGTAMHLGLEAAAAPAPRLTVVVSDGRPDAEGAALDAAARLPGVINVIYCGPDDDEQAVAFMRRLAAVGGGRVVVHDLRRAPALTAPLRSVLALPAPASEITGPKGGPR